VSCLLKKLIRKVIVESLSSWIPPNSQLMR
jgi:hypothetical protein